MLTAVAAGFATSLSLIVAIGAQNAFVLRQGLRREYVLPVVAVCGLADALLIGAGIAGLGALVTDHPLALNVIRYGGAAFLLVYGVLAARRAIRPAGGLTAAGPAAAEPAAAEPAAGPAATGRDATESAPPARTGSAVRDGGAPAPVGLAERAPARLRAVLLTCLGFTFLNPHVYLDTVVLLGALANRYGEGRWLYGFGAIMASLTWFAALGYGAGRLSGFFARPRSWRILDAMIAGIMMMLAAGLALSG